MKGAATARWGEVKEILADALEISDAQTRTAFVENACGGDTTLRAQIDLLLAQSGDAFDSCAEFVNGASSAPLVGRRLGAYRIQREIGRGGMGAVYLAERADGEFEKQVAIKLLKRGTDTDEVLRRFRAERRILARLDHPNIARLLDAGATEDGLPFFVMEYVHGEPITDYARLRQLSTADRLALFLKVCSAVEAAHGNHVIHRDLKASNILVRQDGEPKLLDFGIAKLVDVPDEAVLVTMTQQRRLTPACASPEQARGEPVTKTSDVYALGALLYELLTDVSPHRFSSGNPSQEEIARIICETEPARPSVLRRGLRGDLETIALTALRKEPALRYRSVADFANDVRQHLNGCPIAARRHTRAYLAMRFWRRRKREVAAAALLAAIGVTIGFLLFHSSAERPLGSIKPTNDLVAYDLYLRGKELIDQIATSRDWEGDNRRAIDLLDRAVTHDPKFAVAYAALCEMHLNLYAWVDHTPARMTQATAAVEAAVRLAPDQTETLLAQAHWLGSHKEWSRALELLERVRARNPNDVKTLEAIANAEDCVGKWREARRDMERARELAPDEPNIPNILMMLYRGSREYRRSDEVADAAIAHFPNGPNYYLARKVWSAFDRGDAREAAERVAAIPEKFNASGFKSLLKLSVAFLKRDFAEFAQVDASMERDKFIENVETPVVFMEALVAEQQGDRAKVASIVEGIANKLEAEVQAGGATKGPRNEPLVIANLARAHCYLGRNEEALRESEEAMRLSSRAKDTMNGPGNEIVRAEVLMRTGQTDQALDLLEQLASIPYGPSYGELLTLRWDRLRGDPRFERIVQQLAATANSAPAPTTDLVAYDLFLRGQALMDEMTTSLDWESDNRRAIDLFERAVTHDPNFALAYAHLAEASAYLYVWVDHSDARLAQAKTATEKAAALAPTSAETYRAEGELADAMGDCSRAFERLSLAHRSRPDDAIILSRVAQTEECLGKWDDALRDMQQAKQLAPRNSYIPNYLESMYGERRDYQNSDCICDEAIAHFSNGTIYYRGQRVRNALARGDTRSARARFVEISAKFDPSGAFSLAALRISLAERDYDRFKREFADLAWDHFIEDFKLDAELMRALVAEQQGDRATIESLLVPRREKVAQDTRDVSHTPLGAVARRSARLARIDSYLGRTAEALRESEDAVANTSEPVGKPMQEIIRAEVLMRAGQTDAALEILEQITRVPYGPSYGDLLGMRWDRLRGNARFERIVQQLAVTAKD